MLEKLYNALKKDLSKGVNPSFVNFDPFAPLAYLEGGETKFREPAITPKKAEANDIATIASHAGEWDQGEVWFDGNRITIFQNRGNFVSDSVSMKLEFSDQFGKCMNMEDGRQKISQKALRDLLKIDFYRCGPESLVGVISKVNWDIQSNGESELARGRASLGSKITQQISGMVDIPEYVDLQIPVYESHFSFTATIRFYLEPDAETKNFSFFPLPGQCQKAVELAEKSIGDELVKALPEEYKIYYGTSN